jgi:hypothetical protein
MQRKTKALKRNERTRKGILIAPLKLHWLSSVIEILAANLLTRRLQQTSASGPVFAARMASRPQIEPAHQALCQIPAAERMSYQWAS